MNNQLPVRPKVPERRAFIVEATISAFLSSNVDRDKLVTVTLGTGSDSSRVINPVAHSFLPPAIYINSVPQLSLLTVNHKVRL